MSALSGCRVLDLGIITAGAATSAILADLGAEVIKVESASYQDPFRKWSGEPIPGEDPDLPPFFRMTNRGKKNVGIDLKHPEGRAVFLRLAAKADVVVENFRRGVLDGLDLGYAALKRANPDIVLASISSQGESGPDAAYASFGSTLEAMAGLSSITGYAGGEPVISGIELNYPDQVVAIFAASMISTAVLARRRGGGGVHLDLSQRELTSFLVGEAFLTGSPHQRQGNGEPGIPVQDCFRSADGRWVAVTVDAEAMPAAAELAGGSSAAALGQWIAGRDADGAVAALGEAGVAAATVLDGGEVLAERGKGWSIALSPAPNGELVKGFTFSDGELPSTPARKAVHIGTHTAEVLRAVGGYADAEIARLAAAGAVTLGRTQDGRA